MSRWRKPRMWKVWIYKEAGMWCWDCGLCSPPARGRTQTFEHTWHNVVRHCTRSRDQHHRYVASHRPRR